MFSIVAGRNTVRDAICNMVQSYLNDERSSLSYRRVIRLIWLLLGVVGDMLSKGVSWLLYITYHTKQ